MFAVPPSCPEAVREELQRAFTQYWIDYGACANKLRSALEALMDHFKVKRFRLVTNKRTQKKERKRIDLHQRIEALRRTFPDAVDHLLAAKWIGNTGVHARELTADDIFDAMGLVEEALYELLTQRSSQLKRIAKTINQRKGPRRPTTTGGR